MPVGFSQLRPEKTGLYLLNRPSSEKPKNTVSLYTGKSEHGTACPLACHAALGKIAVAPLSFPYSNNSAPSTRMDEGPSDSLITPVNCATLLSVREGQVS